MLKDTGCGWSEFRIGNFVGHPSYINDVPVMLLKCFVDYYKNYSAAVEFDEEGSSFIFILSNWDTYIIERKNTAILHEIQDEIANMAKECLNDTEDVDAWTLWCSGGDDIHLRYEIKNQLIQLRKELENLLEKKGIL